MKSIGTESDDWFSRIQSLRQNSAGVLQDLPSFDESAGVDAPADDDWLTGINSLRAQIQEPVQPPEDGSLLEDVGRTWLGASSRLGGAVGYGLEKLGAETFGGFVRELAKDSSQYWDEGLTQTSKESRQKEFFTKTADGYEFGDAWADPRAVGLSVVESLPGTIAGGVAGKAVTGGLMAASLRGTLARGLVAGGVGGTEKVFRLIPAIGPKVAAAIGYGSGEAGVASLSSGGATEDQVRAMSFDVLEQSPEYMAALAATGDREQARDVVARAAGNDAAAMTALTTFVLSAPAGAVLSKFFTNTPLATTRGRAIGLGAGTEAVQEFAQSGSEQISQNVAIRDNADPTRQWDEGALNAAAAGAMAGGVMGGGMGAFQPLDQRPAAPDPETPSRARATIDDIANDLRRPYAEAAEEGANQARDIVAQSGGDALSQELAASDVVWSAISQSPTKDDVERTYGRQLQMMQVDEQLAQEAEALRQERLKALDQDGEASVAWMSPGPDGQWRPKAEILPAGKSAARREASNTWGASLENPTGAVRAPKLRSPKRRTGRMDLLWQGQPNEMLGDPADAEEAEAAAAPAPRWEPTGNTVERVMADLSQDADIGAALGTLTSSRALNIVQSPDQLPPEVQAALSQSAETGAPQGLVWKGRMWLVADSIEAGRARGVLLHEGQHYAMERDENSETYKTLQSNFDRLLESGDVNAVRAMRRVQSANTADVEKERVAYFLEEVVNNPDQASGRERMLAARIMQDVRLWFRETKVGKWLEAHGAGFNLTPQEIVQIVKRGMIRQAQTEARTAAPGGLQASRRGARTDLGLYSALSRNVVSLATNAAPSAGWKSAITGMVNKGQVKQEEVEWSGVMDWLDTQDGKVTKEQVADYLDSGGVQVEETVLGMSEASRTQYDGYRAPGGENYREVLLRLPVSQANAAGQAEVERLSKQAGELDVQAIAAWIERRDQAEYTRLRNLSRELRKRATAVEKAAGTETYNYQSTHWDQPNVLAHMRVDDRVDAEGKRVLFVNEIQSDWGQEGKKKGFKGKTQEDAKKFFGITDADWAKSSEEDREAYRFEMLDAKGRDFIPTAPFVTNTSGWVNLALKRVITMASEGGYDRVAVAKGNQNAKLYDQLQDVERVEFLRASEGAYAAPTDLGPGVLRVWGRRGREGRPRLILDKYLQNPAEAEIIIGKDATRKLLEQPGEPSNRGGSPTHIRSLSGLDMQIGGEGMRAFYDEIVPAALKKILPKVGGAGLRTVTINIDGKPTEQVGFDVTPAMREKSADGVPQFSRRERDFEAPENIPPNVPNIFGRVRKPSFLTSAEAETFKGDWDSATLSRLEAQRDKLQADINALSVDEVSAKRNAKAIAQKRVELQDAQRVVNEYIAIRDQQLAEWSALRVQEIVAERGKVREAYLAWQQQQPAQWQPAESEAEKAARENYERVKKAEKEFAVSELMRREGRSPTQLSRDVRFSRRQTETPEFKRWFGDSKVVDADGKPLVVYHGYTGDVTDTPSGPIYLAYDEDVAQEYSELLGSGSGYSAYVSLQNPLILRTGEDVRAVWEDSKALTVDGPFYPDQQSALNEWAEKQGHDGIMVEPSAFEGDVGYEWAAGTFGEPQIVVFEPTNVKSIENQGTFDPENRNIRFSRRQTDRPVPDAVRQAASLEASFEHVGSTSYARNRDLKVSLQSFVKDAARQARIDLTERTPEVRNHLVRAVIADAKYALRANENAIGWYDRTLKRALKTLSGIHPELEADEQARFAFTWALAVTSNGMKVDKNFELAEQAYAGFKATGRMPVNVGEGTAAGAINDGLAMYNTLVDQLGEETVRKLMVTEFTVKELTDALGVDITGELMDTRVRGAAILGPKIGNGFFSNLYGFYDALTMDRWLMRTWGRWTGTLIDVDPDKVAKARTRLREVRDAVMADPSARTQLKGLLRGTVPLALDKFAKAISKQTVKKEFRASLNLIEAAGWGSAKGDTAGAELRKAANALSNALDGQKESPGNGSERNWIREVFNQALTELKAEYPDLTMSDLQALLWYPEKKLYESSKTDETAEGYEEEAAPDYANAAAKLARKKGVDVDGRTAGTGSGVAQSAPGEQEPGRGFAPQERTAFLVDRFFANQSAELVGTQETQTLLTPAGASAYDAFTQLAGRTDLRSAKARADYVKIQRQTMRELSKKVGGEPSPLAQLISAITGVSDPVLIGVDTNASGTFDSVASPNMRLPMRFKSGKKTVVLTRDQVEVMLAVLGLDLKQAAQAASSFKTVSRGAEDTYSVLVEAPAGEDISNSVLQQLDMDLGFPLSYARVPLGWQIDVNIGGFDTRPTIEQVGEAFDKAFGEANIHIVPRAYDSIYLEAKDYGDVLDAFQRTEDSGAGARGGEADGGDGRLGRLESVREALRQIAEKQDRQLADWDAGVRRRIQFSRAEVASSAVDAEQSNQYNPELGAESAPDSAAATPLADIQITDDYVIAETGETVSVTERADIRLRQLDKRLAVARRLVLCLGG